MNALATPIPTRPAPRAVIAETFADLAWIHDPGVNLCIHPRSVSTGLGQFVDELLRHRADEEHAAAVAPTGFDFHQLLRGRAGITGHRDWCADIAALTEAFCDLIGCERAGLRLRMLSGPMCPRFHVDFVPCRLICTYGQTGTEWLPESAVDRSKLGHGAGGLPDDRSGLITADHAIRRMPPYSIALLKGEHWPGNQGRGVVHRSPSLPPERPARLLLTLDPL